MWGSGVPVSVGWIRCAEFISSPGGGVELQIMINYAAAFAYTNQASKGGGGGDEYYDQRLLECDNIVIVFGLYRHSQLHVQYPQLQWPLADFHRERRRRRRPLETEADGGGYSANQMIREANQDQ